MPLEDLREQGVLLPEEEWGDHRLQTTVRQTPVLLFFLLAAASWVAAFLGGGHLLTWIGVGVLFLSFLTVIWLCDRAVKKQRERFEREREAHEHQEPASESTSAGGNGATESRSEI